MDFLEALSRPPLVLGVDPRPELHGPEPLAHLRRYALGLFEALGKRLAAVKFQLAFFEALGPEGMALLEELASGARVMGLPVIFDGKRGDIGSTAEAYAAAYLRRFPGSALTLNPYLGLEALRPFFRAAQETGGAVFVLAKTSNPGSGFLQDLDVAGRPLYLYLAEALAGEEEAGPWSRVGMVVGATYPEAVAAVRRVAPHAPLLLPGVGAQGGSPVRGPGLLNAASRALFYPGGRPDLEGAIRAAEGFLEALVE
ncbi:Orotidine 5'-phosphate decarboxylase [Thermus sp. CCB_US3_UF1]|uniref:orotidine-5'-phosphate decarboxylase n=1 Tax=unclassified Thermus TaxID=2619321 RepID=UPI0002389184|nr:MULTISPECIES: orotidine-5'-phosphate decarboxylase [unclassified Thermus]AEV16995.1 Orotidine 5'-phosphate decarboxylase [Thermus sp. CCB_US3_UF1]MCX7850442.1 orotidine-5'-phosphate decarboxylase [Thermus sp.]MDW8356586.1 orotidine-5'-phosphate decarboxylase [Thermus sp.]